MGRYTEHLTVEPECQKAIAAVTPATRIKLVPEPDNPDDPRAVKAITMDGVKVGYIERDNWLVKAMIDDKTPVASRIIEIGPAAPDSALCRIILEVLTEQDATDALARPARAAANASTRSTKVPTSSRGLGCWALLCVLLLVIYLSTSQCRSGSPTPAQSSAPAASQGFQFNEAAMIVAGVGAKKAIQRLLRDPDSAEFESVVGHEVTSDQFIFCGTVNAKNGFGGYQGPKAFITLSSAEAYIDDGKKDFRDMWEYVCNEKSRAHQAYF